jgi:hypothetical protein
MLIACAALAIACTGVTPAVAVRALRGIVFANNADKVDGIKASRKPKPGRLLALDKHGKFSTSVFPDGVRGPRGPQGPEGQQGPGGPPGLATAYVDTPADTALSRNNGVPTTVGTITNVPPGAYIAMFKAEATMRNPGGIYVLCDMQVNGARISEVQGIVGDAYGGDEDMSDMATISRSSSFDVSVACRPDQTTTSLPSGPGVQGTRIVLVQIQNLATSSG